MKWCTSFVRQERLHAHLWEGDDNMENGIAECAHCGVKNRIKTPPKGQVPVCSKCRNPLPWIINGTDTTFRNELDTALPVLVDFWADWCAPCRMMSPVLEDFAGQEAGRVKVMKVNVDQNPATAGQFKILSIPTLILFKKGRPMETITGAVALDALRHKLRPHLSHEPHLS
jgi:thioredoxin 2